MRSTVLPGFTASIEAAAMARRMHQASPPRYHCLHFAGIYFDGSHSSF